MTEPKGIGEWRSSGTTRAILPAFFLFCYIFIIAGLLALIIWIFLPFIIAIPLGVFSYWISILSYKKTKFCIKPDKILIRTGILSTNLLEIPMIRIQSIKVERNILERWKDQGTLHIDTAGAFTWNTRIYSIEDYQDLADYILQRSEEARLATDVPKMVAVSPDVDTVREVQKVARGFRNYFGKTGQSKEGPSAEVMNSRFSMSPKMKLVWTLETLVPLLAIVGILSLGLLIIPNLLCGIFIGVLLLAVIALSRTYAVANFDNYTFHFDRDALTIRHGIFDKNNVKIPYKRIQNINIYSTYFGRMMGLHTLVIETGAGVGHIHGIETPDSIVNFLLEQAEDARFDDALGDVSELEDYHIKLLRQVKKINYRLNERLGNFENPFDHRSPEIKAPAFLDERTKDYFALNTFLGLFSLLFIISLYIALFSFLGYIFVSLFRSPFEQNTLVQQMGLALGMVIGVVGFLTAIPIMWYYSKWYANRRYNSYLLRFDYDSFFSRYGVWTINDEMIPYRRIQNAYIHQNLLERHYGIWSVSVHAPGIHRTFPGIINPQAMAAFILRKAEEARVDEAHDMKSNIISEIAYDLKMTNKELTKFLSKDAKPIKTK